MATTTEVTVQTITEVTDSTGEFVITCSASLNEDGTEFPSIFKSQVLETEKTVDNTSGLEGELMLSYSEDTVGEINDDGELEIELEEDDVEKYSKEDENLIYTE